MVAALVLFQLFQAVALTGVGPPAVRQDSRRALRALDLAVREGDEAQFLAVTEGLLRRNPPRTLRKVVDAFSAFQTARGSDTSAYYRFHSGLAKILSALKDRASVKEIQRLQLKAGDWRGRLLLLDVASLHPAISVLESALGALKDRSPVVIRRSLFYLKNTETLEVVDAILGRFLEVDRKRKTYKGAEWERTRLAFRDALTAILKVNLPAADDYKNYLSVRRDAPDLFDPEKARGGGLTGLSIFGTEISGTNVTFVLDVSGSMMATDPIPVDSPRGKTGVGRDGESSAGDGAGRPDPSLVESRRRIHRAKKELSKVIRALPEDVKFNVIAYSSDVVPWKKNLVPASGQSRKDAVKFVSSLKAEGVTVTDLALEEAFRDFSVDTVYLITDGAPTHIGSRGRERPRDADRLMEAILERVAKLNFLRGVRIFTLGFPEAEEEFLKKLSGENAGSYAPIR